MSDTATAFIQQVEAVLNSPDPGAEPLAMWLRRTLEKYREADRLWERRIDESRVKNAHIAALETGNLNLREMVRFCESHHHCGTECDNTASAPLPGGKE